jgi:tRNA (mo5U34)-methyltransferase
MSVRRWERAGWSVTIGVPEAVAERVRRFARRRGTRRPHVPAADLAGAGLGERSVHVDAEGRALRLASAPRVTVIKRNPQAAVDAFLAHAPPQVTGDKPLAEAIAAERWYHTIELPDGTVTRGRFDHRPLLPYYGLPDSMAGMRALDVGTADGFWAFEMERRGARVVALELPRLSDRDFPPAAKRIVRDQADTPPGRRFELARRALASAAELVRLPIYDIDPARLGTFDFVHVGDVLLHVRDPAGALAAIRSVTSGEAHIADSADPRLDTHDHRNLTAYLGGWQSTTWWTPSVQTLAQMALDAGFADVEVLGMYRLEIRGGSGIWRAVLRATP